MSALVPFNETVGIAERPFTVRSESDPLFTMSVTPAISVLSKVVAVTALMLTVSTDEELTPVPRLFPPAIDAVIERVSAPSPPARLSPAVRVVEAAVAAVATNESAPAPPVFASTPVVSDQISAYGIGK